VELQHQISKIGVVEGMYGESDHKKIEFELNIEVEPADFKPRRHWAAMNQAKFIKCSRIG